MHLDLHNVNWTVVYIVCQGAWSVFWSYAPTPQPNTWYNAIFQVAQYLALNFGRADATRHNNKNAATTTDKV